MAMSHKNTLIIALLIPVNKLKVEAPHCMIMLITHITPIHTTAVNKIKENELN